jgi:hypothetical protein
MTAPSAFAATTMGGRRVCRQLGLVAVARLVERYGALRLCVAPDMAKGGGA